MCCATTRSVRSSTSSDRTTASARTCCARRRRWSAVKRPDIEIVGDELHPLGRIKDFAPYAAKIKASGAQAVLTGNWGNDLTLLVKAARDAGVDARFYTFYGNAPRRARGIGERRRRPRARRSPNGIRTCGTAASDRFYAASASAFPRPQDDYRACAHARDDRDARGGDGEGARHRCRGGGAGARRAGG
jgi:branched-chain amino acid transport system substrate-binding protein